MATPIDEHGFYYNHKINCMPTRGSFTLGSDTYDFHPDAALASLDWGRGVWPYSTYWIWASASGFLPDRRTVGLNLGHGFGDLSAATENCFYVDGRMTKLGLVDIAFDESDTNKPWTFTADDGRLALTFTPFHHRRSNIDVGLVASKVNQMFGSYSGKLVDDAGTRYDLDNLIGWAENHRARW